MSCPIETTPPVVADDRDRGSILIFVLVTIVIISFAAVPLLYYVTTVMRGGQVQSNRAEAVELAEGGVWVSLNKGGEKLFDDCGTKTFVSSLGDVDVECSILEVEALRPLPEVPFHIATVQADEEVPATFQSGFTTNPSTASDPGAWLTAPGTTQVSEAGKIWLPDLPVQSVSTSSDRVIQLGPPAIPASEECTVYYPGTFTSPITLDGPTYFVSGVYYFTQPITLQRGADVVVGAGGSRFLGCTTDQVALFYEGADGVKAPQPANASGFGGTFVFGDEARIEVDDSVGTGDIRFVMQRRYVHEDETSVLASKDVSIISVNGDHAPFAVDEAVGDPLDIPGTMSVPASQVGIDGRPAANTRNYLPSTLTPKPTEPDAPTLNSVEPYQLKRAPVGARNDGVKDGMLVVDWNAPNDNGSLITEYTAFDATTGESCTVSVPVGSGLTVPTSCVITDLGHQNISSGSPRPAITVSATNGVGTSVASAEFPVVFDPNTRGTMPRLDLVANDQARELAPPLAPSSVTIGDSYDDGLEVKWVWNPPAPTSDQTVKGWLPVTGYRVVATPFLDPGIVLDPSDTDPLSPFSPANPANMVGPDVTCDARFDENRCVLDLDPLAFGYDVDVVAVADHGHTSDLTDSVPASVSNVVFVADAGSPRPPARTPLVVVPRTPTPILDFATDSGANTTITIEGYISVPQGVIDVSDQSSGTTDIKLDGGVLAAKIDVDTATTPETFNLEYDNPVAQKTIRIKSTADRQAVARADVILQVNKSGSLAINSWVVQ